MIATNDRSRATQSFQKQIKIVIKVDADNATKIGQATGS
jgi:hypothetical protein